MSAKVMKPLEYLRSRPLPVLALAMAYQRVLARGQAPKQYRRPRRPAKQLPLLEEKQNDENLR